MYFRRKLSNFLRQPSYVKIWFIPAWLLLGWFRILLQILPFPKIANRLGFPAGTRAWVPLINAGQELRARRVAKVVALAARYTPWISDCFPKALTAQALLGACAVPGAVFFGMGRSAVDGDWSAHAWVTSGRVYVTGGNAFSRYVVVGCYVPHDMEASFEQ